MPDENYEIKSALHEAKLKEIGHAIKDSLPPSMGFCLFLFDYSIVRKGKDDHGATFYMSSASREETIELLEEFIAKQKHGNQKRAD